MLLGLQVILDDEAAAQRSAHKHAGDQAEGGGGGAHAHSGGVAQALKGGAVRAGCSVAADHGDGGGQQGVGGLQAHRGAYGDADDVLEDGDHAGAQPVDDQ